MEKAGFAECRTCGYLESRIPCLEDVEQQSRLERSIAVEGRKP
jgi:hypothetical protein